MVAGRDQHSGSAIAVLKIVTKRAVSLRPDSSSIKQITSQLQAHLVLAVTPQQAVSCDSGHIAQAVNV